MPGRADSADELVKRVQSAIGDDLTRVNQILEKQFQNPHPYLADVLQHAGRFRGKQIRPILLLLWRKSINGHIEDSALTLGAAVEMIHTATLVHDDVLDKSLSRTSSCYLLHTPTDWTARFARSSSAGIDRTFFCAARELDEADCLAGKNESVKSSLLAVIRIN